MSPALVQSLRFVHIVAGSFWVGAASVLAFFVLPTMLAADITGARLMKNIMITRNLRFYSLGAMLLTLASGAYLYWGRFAQTAGGQMTRPALDYAIGGFLGLLAGGIILFVNAPTGTKLGAIIDSTGAATPTAEQSAEITRLSRKLLIATRMVAILVLGAASFMALARFASNGT